MHKKLTIGILALQGAFREHANVLKALDVRVVEVRLPSHLKDIQGLIIPGGESTTIKKLMLEYAFPGEIRKFASLGKPIFGTCAGLIVMAKKVHGRVQDFLNLIDIDVERNAYGRQIDSREVDLDIPALGEKTFRAVFIRAPQIIRIGRSVAPLGHYQNQIIFARQKNILVATFHPELTGDKRIHEYFIQMCSNP